jgi:hypothetical protein
MLLEKSKLIKEQSIDSKIKALKSDRRIAQLQQIEQSQENDELILDLESQHQFYLNKSMNEKQESNELLS